MSIRHHIRASFTPLLSDILQSTSRTCMPHKNLKHACMPHENININMPHQDCFKKNNRSSMLSSLKLFTLMALIALTFARKHSKGPKTSCQLPTGCTSCAGNQMCKIFSDGSDSCPYAKCEPYEGCLNCLQDFPLCDDCGDDAHCEVMPQTCFSCASAVCVPNNEPCAVCPDPKNTCDSCGLNQVCVIEPTDVCDCPEPKCVTPPDLNVFQI